MKRVLWMAALVASQAVGQWGQFRGPNGSGVDGAKGYPEELSPTKNLVWKSAVPYGQSSPVLAGGQVYVTASEGAQLLTICLDAKSGKELWRRAVKRERPMQMYKANDPASPTPAADELGVYAFFPEYGLVAYTPQGKERWSVALGPFKNFYGMAGSPIVTGEMLVQVCDQVSGSYAIAVDRKTGRTKWKTERTGVTIGWSTPMVFRPASGPTQLIVLGSTRLDGYDLETGALRWWMPVASAGGLGVPVAMGDTLLVSTLGSSDPWMPTFESMLEKYDKDKDGKLSLAEFKGDADLGEHFGWLDTSEDGLIVAKEWEEASNMGKGEFGAIALKPSGKRGALTPGDAVWRFKKNLAYIPAPVLYEGVYYMLKSGGIVTSLDAATGQRLKEGRARDALGEYYASPVAADGKVYLASLAGKVSVLKAGGEWDVLSMTDLGEEIHATPALGGGRVYVRTQGALYCFGAGH